MTSNESGPIIRSRRLPQSSPMSFDRSSADTELFSDLFVGESGCSEKQYFLSATCHMLVSFNQYNSQGFERLDWVSTNRLSVPIFNKKLVNMRGFVDIPLI